MNNIARALINPFDRIAGWKSFLIGITIVVATVVVGWQSSMCFPGALDAKVVYQLNLNKALLCQAISLLSLVLVFYVCAFIFAKGTRFQDILGTITLSRFPYLFIAVLGFMSSKEDLATMNQLVNSGNILDLISFFKSNLLLIAQAFLMIPFLIWTVILLYNAFRVSTGLKGTKCGILFTISLIVAEVLSLVLIFTIAV